MTAKQLPETLRRDFEAKLGDSLVELYEIWDDIGIVEEQRAERVNVVFYHLHDLLKEMLEEEKNMRNKMLARIEKYSEELLKLTHELDTDKYEPSSDASTLQLEKELRHQVETLTKIKHERLKQLKRLKVSEEALCDNLCMTPYYIPSGQVPSEEQLKELNVHINTLTQEQSKRRALFNERKAAITSLERELERAPCSSLERELGYDNDSSFVLSTENLNKMTQLQKELEKTYETNSSLANELRDRLDVLWTRLEVPDDERSHFNQQNTGFKPSVIQALRDKIGECELLKVSHMEKFIAGVREELVSWWDKCFITQADRDLFYLFKQEDLTEELLDAHDEEVQRMKDYYQRNATLFTKISKRQNMFKLYKDLEAKANDPNRFNNRGGQLLQEEKQRKKLLKDLPKMEADLAEDIVRWETENGRDFTLDGLKFPDYIEQAWDRLKHQKENEKMERQRKQAKLMEEEMIYGSKPVTPAKKRFTSTPSKTPNAKFRKIATPGMNATSRTPGSTTMSRTHMTSTMGSHVTSMAAPSPLAALPPKAGNQSKPAQKQTPRRLRENKERRKSFQRKILSEKNNQQQTSTQPEKSFSQTILTRSTRSRQDISTLAPPGTEFTYREFVQGISTDARSSILVIPPDAKDVHV